MVRAKVFGLNFMRLDIRQHSDVHERAVHELLKQINPWLLKSSLPDESRKIYNIKIPVNNSSLIFSELD